MVRAFEGATHSYEICHQWRDKWQSVILERRMRMFMLPLVFSTHICVSPRAISHLRVELLVSLKKRFFVLGYRLMLELQIDLMSGTQDRLTFLVLSTSLP